MPRSAVFFAATLAASLGSSHLHAQEPARARADALYEEGTRLMDQGAFDRACPMFVESHRLDPAAGGLLAIALCRERAGEIGTAWTTYGEAAALALATGDREREAAARRQMDLLAPRLPRVILRLAPEWPTGTTVTRNGVPFPIADLGSPVVVDPGTMRFAARSADGRTASQGAISIAEAQTVEVLIPAPTTATAAPPTTPSKAPAEAERQAGLGGVGVAGLVVGGVGGVGLALGSVFGVVASGQSSDAEDLCAPFRGGEGGSLSAHGDCAAALDDARSSADLSTVFLIGGGIVAGAGLTMLVVDLAGDGGASSGAQLVPLGPGAALRGRF